MPQDERDVLAAELDSIPMSILRVVVARITKKETTSPADVDRFMSTCTVQQLQTLLGIARGLRRVSDWKTIH